MCGIVGFNMEDKALLRKMADLITHRGPDDEALFTAKGISLGMRRLSIIDLKKGIYPITNEDGTLFLVFNGEIYNYLEIRHMLEAQGHRFSTDCDAEVIVHLYEEHGRKAVEFLNGIFAIALWDSRKRQLMLARDRLGVKPLYYHFDGRNLVFGSEAKSILLFPGFRKEVNTDALHDYLTFRCNSTPETMFKGIFKLQPGHLLVLDSQLAKKGHGHRSISIER
jgi:asparagine synthase (glutamine-hydrolysing)